MKEEERDEEREIRDVIGRNFKDNGIMGEEYGEEKKERRNVWIIDKVDGKRDLI